MKSKGAWETVLHPTSSTLCRLGTTYHEESRSLLRRSCDSSLRNFLGHDAGNFRFDLDVDDANDAGDEDGWDGEAVNIADLVLSGFSRLLSQDIIYRTWVLSAHPITLHGPQPIELTGQENTIRLCLRLRIGLLISVYPYAERFFGWSGAVMVCLVSYDIP